MKWWGIAVLGVIGLGATTLVVERMEPFVGDDGAPALLIVLVSGRRAFFEYVYGTSGFEDDMEVYGPAIEPLRFDGEHFDIVTQCLSNRLPEFTQALEDFLSRP